MLCMSPESPVVADTFSICCKQSVDCGNFEAQGLKEDTFLQNLFDLVLLRLWSSWTESLESVLRCLES